MENDNKVSRKPPSIAFLVSLFFLYLMQGFPQGIVFFSIPTVLRSENIDLKTIAMLMMTGIFWAIKFLWAPFVDNHWIKMIGRRKSWIFLMQLLLVISLFLLSFLQLNASNIALIAILLGTMSFAGATQDIATDALAAENSDTSHLGIINTIQMSAILLGILISGPISLVLFEKIHYQNTLWFLVGLVLITFIPIFFLKEKVVQLQPRKKSTLPDFFRLPLAKPSLILCSLVTVCGVITIAIVKFILVDRGWSMERVGLLTGGMQLVVMLLGCCTAGMLIDRFGYRFILNAGLAMVLIGAGLWTGITLALLNASWHIYCSTFIVSFGMGLVAVSIFSYSMRFAQSTSQPGTNMAIFQSTQTFLEIVFSSMATALAGAYGYSIILVMGMVIALGCFVALNKLHYFVYFDDIQDVPHER